MSRIAARFAALKNENRAGFIPFIMAGDPDYETSLEILRGLPAAGADIIELGVAFTDPMADGPVIQAAGLRALKAGQTLRRTLDMVRAFRDEDATTPIILMGYYNPVHAFGIVDFTAAAARAGVDGLIVVDAPPEEDGPLRAAANEKNLDLIRLATPTTDDARLPTVLDGASGFIYYVSIAGVTGRASAGANAVSEAVKRLKGASDLPVAVGFGVKTPEQAAETARAADAVVVGSALVARIGEADGSMTAETARPLEPKAGEADIDSSENRKAAVHAVLSLARDIATAIKKARA